MTVLGRFLEGFLTGVVVTLVLTLALPATIVACYRRWKRRSSARYHELQPMGTSGNTYSEPVRSEQLITDVALRSPKDGSSQGRPHPHGAPCFGRDDVPGQVEQTCGFVRASHASVRSRSAVPSSVRPRRLPFLLLTLLQR